AVEKTADSISQSVGKVQEIQTQQGKTLSEATSKVEQHSKALEMQLKMKDVELYMPNSRIKEVLQTGEVQLNEEQNIYGITIVTNRVPLYVKGEIVGAIATFRDKTEIRKLAEERISLSIKEALEENNVTEDYSQYEPNADSATFQLSDIIGEQLKKLKK
ncbi:hypothetical protein ACT4US_08445, partial [Bacillus sp. HC-Mk]